MMPAAVLYFHCCF